MTARALVLACGLAVGVLATAWGQSPLTEAVIVERFKTFSARREALEHRTARLSAEQELLRRDVAVYEADRQAFKRDLDAYYGCDYSVQARACAPGTETR